MGSWSENARRYKLERWRDAPDGRHKSSASKKPTLKHLMDRLKAREADLEQAQRWFDNHFFHWERTHYENCLKKVNALKAEIAQRVISQP